MIEKFDRLNRVIYRRLDECHRFIYKYYGNTNLTKIKINLIWNEQVLYIYNKKGKIIYSDETNKKFLKLKNFKISNEEITIKIPEKIREDYQKIIKELINKNKK
jgi:hypothetical protein